MNSIKKLVVLLTAWAISFLLVALLFEVGLRVKESGDVWSKTQDINLLRDVEYQYELNGLYESEINTVKYVRNEFGLRDDCASPQEIDILTIGGSTTDQRYVAFKDTFQSTLQKLLSEHSRKKVCVSNAGLDGHSTHGHIRAFQDWFPLIPNLKPQYVLLYIGINDANFNIGGPNVGFDVNTAGSIKGFLKSLSLVRTLYPLYRFVRDGGGKQRLPYAGHNPTKPSDLDYTITELNDQTKAQSKIHAEAFRGRLKSILASITTMGASPVCVTQPHRFLRNIGGTAKGIPNVLGDGFSGLDYDYSVKKLNAVMMDLCGKKNTIDIHSANFEDRHFYDGVHTTGIGSQYLGKMIFSQMKEKILEQN